MGLPKMTKLVEIPSKGTEGRLVWNRRYLKASSDVSFECDKGRFRITNYDVYVRLIDPEALAGVRRISSGQG